jgi:hypothetical protein
VESSCKSLKMQMGKLLELVLCYAVLRKMITQIYDVEAPAESVSCM